MKFCNLKRGSGGLVLIIILSIVVIIGGLLFYNRGEDSQTLSKNEILNDNPSPSATSFTVSIKGQGGSGLSGEAFFAEAGASSTRVSVKVKGLEEGAIHPAHIHSGSCAGLGEIAYVLDGIVASTTENIIPVTLDELIAKLPLALNIHKSEEELNVSVACGDVPNPNIIVQGDEVASTTTKAVTKDGCVITGCSGQVCAEEEITTTCEFLPEYACYKDAVCERQPDGSCGWRETPDFLACIEGAKQLPAVDGLEVN
jgi:hypothetical protein